MVRPGGVFMALRNFLVCNFPHLFTPFEIKARPRGLSASEGGRGDQRGAQVDPATHENRSLETTGQGAARGRPNAGGTVTSEQRTRIHEIQTP
jgi:hypothetical protein